jgi:hypothetical protein
MPRYWVQANEVAHRLEGRWDHDWLLGWRDICRNTDARTVIAGIIPAVAVGHKLPLMQAAAAPKVMASLYQNLCSYALDFAARQKLGGTSLTYFVLKQLPLLAPTDYGRTAAWSGTSTVGEWLLPRVLELTYTSWELEGFGRDFGYEGPPFRWDSERRFLLRCELDAAFFHLYGIARDDVDYIMDTFPIVKRKDEEVHGHYRTKDQILDIYDRLQQAIDSGESYQTVLNPPPAHPSCAHPESTRPDWAKR